MLHLKTEYIIEMCLLSLLGDFMHISILLNNIENENETGYTFRCPYMTECRYNKLIYHGLQGHSNSRIIISKILSNCFGWKWHEHFSVAKELRLCHRHLIILFTWLYIQYCLVMYRIGTHGGKCDLLVTNTGVSYFKLKEQ